MPKKIEGDVRLHLDCLAFNFIGTIAPMSHGSHCSRHEGGVTVENGKLLDTAVDADHCFQADFSTKGSIRNNRVAKPGLRRFCDAWESLRDRTDGH